MKLPAFDPRDVIGGAVLIGIGLTAVAVASDYSFGTARRMVPGYFPVVLGWICAVLGVAVVGKGFVRRMWDEGGMELPSLRAVLGITLGIAAFILAGSHLGLVPAILLLVGISALVDRGNSPLTAGVLALAVAIGGVAIFIYGLGIIFPLFTGGR